MDDLYLLLWVEDDEMIIQSYMYHIYNLILVKLLHHLPYFINLTTQLVSLGHFHAPHEKACHISVLMWCTIDGELMSYFI